MSDDVWEISKAVKVKHVVVGSEAVLRNSYLCEAYFLAPPPLPVMKIIAQSLRNAHTYEEHNFFQRLDFKVMERVRNLRRLKYMFLH